MLNVSNVTLQFGKRVLFEDVNIKFHGERCYGLIGANGAGKSTFLKILSGEISPNSGGINLESGKRMSVLSQNHFAFDEETVLNTVIQGNEPLWNLMQKKDAIYMKPDFNEEDGLIAADLEVQFEEIPPSSPVFIEGIGHVHGLKTTVFLKVVGAGHYLPEYAGNLDIMTSAAMATGERMIKKEVING